MYMLLCLLDCFQCFPPPLDIVIHLNLGPLIYWKMGLNPLQNDIAQTHAYSLGVWAFRCHNTFTSDSYESNGVQEHLYLWSIEDNGFVANPPLGVEAQACAYGLDLLMCHYIVRKYYSWAVPEWYNTEFSQDQ